MWDRDNSWNDCGPNSSCGIESRDLAQYRAGNWAYAGRHSRMNNNLYSDGHVGADHWGSVTWDQLVGPWNTTHNGVSVMTS